MTVTSRFLVAQIAQTMGPQTQADGTASSPIVSITGEDKVHLDLRADQDLRDQKAIPVRPVHRDHKDKQEHRDL